MRPMSGRGGRGHAQRAAVAQLAGNGCAQRFGLGQSAYRRTGLRAHQGQPALPLPELAAGGHLRYIPFPDDLKGRYQSHTQADLTRLRAAGYAQAFSDVQTGVSAYAGTLLASGRLALG